MLIPAIKPISNNPWMQATPNPYRTKHCNANNIHTLAYRCFPTNIKERWEINTLVFQVWSLPNNSAESWIGKHQKHGVERPEGDKEETY